MLGPTRQVGDVAKPYRLDDPDPEKQAAAKMLDQWRVDSRRVYPAATQTDRRCDEMETRAMVRSWWWE